MQTGSMLSDPCKLDYSSHAAAACTCCPSPEVLLCACPGLASHGIHTGGDESGQQHRGAAFGFNYSQLQQGTSSPPGQDISGDPLGLSAAGSHAQPAAPQYRPPFAAIPWQLSASLPHDHLSHQVGPVACMLCTAQCVRSAAQSTASTYLRTQGPHTWSSTCMPQWHYVMHLARGVLSTQQSNLQHVCALSVYHTPGISHRCLCCCCATADHLSDCQVCAGQGHPG
jgi:hypothetical protein